MADLAKRSGLLVLLAVLTATVKWFNIEAFANELVCRPDLLEPANLDKVNSTG
jgi:hypothetical protein